MHIGRGFEPGDVLWWTRREIGVFTLVASVASGLHAFGFDELAVPWVLVGLLGNATAFLVGFKNNATYNRMWEARTIWGGIVNDSRAFAMGVRDWPSGPEEVIGPVKRKVLERHVAWLTALRHQLREPRAWETANTPENVEYRAQRFPIDEVGADLGPRLLPYLSADEHAQVMKGTNKAAQILALQSDALAHLERAGSIDSVAHAALRERLGSLMDQQGRCERIKNFPYPRQYATANKWVLWLFALLVPFALTTEVAKVTTVWLTVPLSVVVTWVFSTLEKIGEVTANPFEGGANDVPITTLSRSIEIDLRQMWGDVDIPPPIPPTNSIQS